MKDYSAACSCTILNVAKKSIERYGRCRRRNGELVADRASSPSASTRAKVASIRVTHPVTDSDALMTTLNRKQSESKETDG